MTHIYASQVKSQLLQKIEWKQTNKQTNKQTDTTNHVLPYTLTRSVIILPRNHIANFTLQAHFLYSRTQTRRQGAALGAYTLGIVELCDYARA